MAQEDYVNRQKQTKMLVMFCHQQLVFMHLIEQVGQYLVLNQEGIHLARDYAVQILHLHYVQRF